MLTIKKYVSKNIILIRIPNYNHIYIITILNLYSDRNYIINII